MHRIASSCIVLPCSVLHSVSFNGSISMLYTSKIKPASTGGTTANFPNSKFLDYIPGTYYSWLFALFFPHEKESGEPRAMCCQCQLCVPTIPPLQPSVVSTCRNQKSKEDDRVYVDCKQRIPWRTESRNRNQASGYTLGANNECPDKPNVRFLLYLLYTACRYPSVTESSVERRNSKRPYYEHDEHY